MTTSPCTRVITRLAPSPTGAQHVGNARTYLLTWLAARSQGGQVLLRIEDIDSPRIKPWATQQAIDDLLWLGLDWDDEPIIQTQRRPMYDAALQQMQQAERVYPCTCSRTDIEAAASAPHLGQEGPVYPGTCAQRRAVDAGLLTDRPYAWRYRVAGPSTTVGPRSTFSDLVAGVHSRDVGRELGDFVVGKADGTPAYQLAVVVDDHMQQVNLVVRGDDLLCSTHRQLLLYQSFGWTPPEFAHVPLVIGPDGRRLAKRHGDTRISLLREQGLPGKRLVGWLAWSCGLLPTPRDVYPRELLPHFDWDLIPRSPCVFTPEDWAALTLS